jgi:hypothetical protein
MGRAVQRIDKIIKARKQARVVALCVVVVTVVLAPGLSRAEKEPGLEEILSGFDDGPEVDNELPALNDRGKTADDFSEDEILEGFDEEGHVVATVSEDKPQRPSFLNLDGYLKLSSAYNLHGHKAEGTDTQWHGLSSLKTELKLELDARLPAAWQMRISGHGFYDFAYRINGRSDYSDEVVDQYEKEIELEEAWLMGGLTGNLDLKAGRQIAVWGRSDNIRITDVLNPLDLRVPGLTDIENLKLPVTMTRLEYFFADLSLETIAVHELRFNKNPKFGSDFFPGDRRGPGRDSDAGLTFDDTQFAAALNGIFRGWDASLYGAYIFDDFAYIRVKATGIPPRLERRHARIKMLGGAGNVAWGNWLFLAETAFFDDLKFSNTPGNTYTRWDGLIGLEYSGFRDTTLAIEVANQHLFDFDRDLKQSPDRQREDLFQSAVRLTQTYMNDTLTLTALANTFGVTGDQGALQRFSAEYDYTDSIQFTAGVVFYQSGDLRRTQSIGSNDRVYVEVKYNF